MNLVTYVRYVAITGDTSTASADVADALADAQELLENELCRQLDSKERTERLRIYPADGYFPGGRVHPTVTPVTAAEDYTILDDGTLTGASPQSGVFDFDAEPYAEVTYTGGFTPGTVPACIERDIAWCAYRLVRPAEAAAVPAGAASVRLGDAGVSFGPGGAPAGAVTWSPRSLRYRRRRV